MTRKKLVPDQIILCIVQLMIFAITTIETSLQTNFNCNPKTICKMGGWKTSTNSHTK